MAAANPNGGVYQKGKSIRDNLKIKNTILSRFDLIFLMLDKPDPLRD
jgi:DNA helicase MCM8